MNISTLEIWNDEADKCTIYTVRTEDSTESETDKFLQEKGYIQKDLAERMNKRPSEINKWLKGNHNLTLKTIAKLEAELGEPIIYTSSDLFPRKPKKKAG